MNFIIFYLMFVVLDLLLVVITFSVLIPFVPPFTQLKGETMESHLLSAVALSFVPVVNYIVGMLAVVIGFFYFVIEGFRLTNSKPLYKQKGKE